MIKLSQSHFQPKSMKVSDGDKLHHVFEEADCYALWAAYAANRPLLLRGAPGTGKSQLAKAIAHSLGWLFVKETINGSTELSDLHWFFDAISRLGEAQIQRSGEQEDDKLEALNPLNFLSPGAFWWAYDWNSANWQYERCKTRLRSKPQPPEEWQQGGVVLLIDEIDKAQPDLPNGLLETLGDLSFNVPYLSSEPGEKHRAYESSLISANQQRPLLVVFTTNEERELPQAFLRRCFVHTLAMEKSRSEVALAGEDSPLVEKRIAWLVKRGQLHFGKRISEEAYIKAAQLVWNDHQTGSAYNPGLAEYIDLLRAIADHEQQSDILDKISGFALKKEAQF